MGAVYEVIYAHKVGEAFRGLKPLSKLNEIGPPYGYVHSSDAVVFLDNHDYQRYAADDSSTISFRHIRALKMGTAFMLAFKFGCPSIMSSFDFDLVTDGPPTKKGTEDICSHFESDCHGWVLEHRWRTVVEMVKFRNSVGGSRVKYWRSFQPDQIAFCRGDRGFIAFNNSRDLPLDYDMFVCVSEGVYCDVMSKDDKGQCLSHISVNENRVARIHIPVDKIIPIVSIYVKA